MSVSSARSRRYRSRQRGRERDQRGFANNGDVGVRERRRDDVATPALIATPTPVADCLDARQRHLDDIAAASTVAKCGMFAERDATNTALAGTAGVAIVNSASVTVAARYQGLLVADQGRGSRSKIRVAAAH